MSMVNSKHGLINYIDTEANCRHLKYWPVKRLCDRCLSEFIDRRYIQSSWYFRPNFVNCACCPSPPPPTPSLCEQVHTVNTYTVCKGGEGMSFGLRERKTCRKVYLQVIFLDDDILIWCLYSSFVHDLKFYWRNVPVTSSLLPQIYAPSPSWCIAYNHPQATVCAPNGWSWHERFLKLVLYLGTKCASVCITVERTLVNKSGCCNYFAFCPEIEITKVIWRKSNTFGSCRLTVVKFFKKDLRFPSTAGVDSSFLSYRTAERGDGSDLPVKQTFLMNTQACLQILKYLWKKSSKPEILCNIGNNI